MSKCPLSRYWLPGYYSEFDIQEPDTMGTVDPDRLSVYSGSTEVYWPLGYDVKWPPTCPTVAKVLRPAHPKTASFNILVHGIWCHKPRYYFKCKEPNCVYSFCTLKGWNLHHRMAHKTLNSARTVPENSSLQVPTEHIEICMHHYHSHVRYVASHFHSKVPCECTG